MGPGCSGNQPGKNKNRMSANPFSEFASQLSQFIGRLRSSSSETVGTEGACFEDLALRLFRLQFEHNLPYRNFCRAQGITEAKLALFAKIPAVNSAAFKDLDFTGIPPDQRTAVFHSSGTTGQQPSRHFHNPDSLRIYGESLLTWFQAQFGLGSEWSGFTPAFLTPPPMAAPQSSLVHMFEVLRRDSGATQDAFLGAVAQDNTWGLDWLRINDFLRKAIAARRPVFLFGTAFSFVHLLDYLAERGEAVRLPQGSRVMETGGYKGRSRALPKSELHALITRWLGVGSERILCEYGMSELSSQAYDSAGLGGVRHFRFPPWARARVISPETGEEVCDGETGIIRVLDLANVYSVLAIETQDLAIRRGDAFELVGRAAEVEPRGCSLMAA